MKFLSFAKRYGKRIAFHLVSICIISMLVVVGYAAIEYRQLVRQWYVPIDGQAQQTAKAPSESEPVIDLTSVSTPMKPFVALILGIDSRDGERARSDTIMLAAINPGKQSAYLISIPRDSYLDIPGKGHDKVNHAMAFGGPKLVKQSLESFLGIEIDRYVSVDFDGFRKIVDELGGIPIDVKKRMKYSDPSDDTYIDLQPGMQTLNGEQALDYARYRKSDLGKEDSDYQRIARQQEIMQAIAVKGASPETLSKIHALMQIMGQHVKMDLTEGEIAALLLAYGNPGDNLFQTDTLTGRDERIWQDGVLGWYHLVPSPERQRTRQQIQAVLSSSS